MKRIQATSLLALLVSSPWAYGIEPNTVFCGAGMHSVPTYAASVHQRCGNGETVTQGVCAYMLPCIVVTDALRTQAEVFFSSGAGHKTWESLTDQQRAVFLRGQPPSAWNPAIVSCTGGSVDAVSGVASCPPVQECMRDVSLQMRPAMPRSLTLDSTQLYPLNHVGETPPSPSSGAANP